MALMLWRNESGFGDLKRVRGIVVVAVVTVVVGVVVLVVLVVLAVTMAVDSR